MILKQYIKIRFSGNSPERFLNMCKHKRIQIWNLVYFDDSYECYMMAKDFRKIKSLVKKAKLKVSIIEKYGFGFSLFQYRKRKIFLLGIGFCVIFLSLMTQRVWKIEFSGNYRITDDILYEYLDAKKIAWGMKTSAVDCESICKMLRRDFQDLIWVSSSLEGTKLKIHIKEKEDTIEQKENNELYQDIESDIAGTVTKIITRKGVPLVKEGDEIAVGALLVSGKIPILDDAGTVIREELVCADADIYVKRIIYFCESCDNTFMDKRYQKKQYKEIALKILGYRFTFGISKKDVSQEILEDHKTIVPFLSIADRTIRTYEEIEMQRSVEEQKKILESAFYYFKEELDKQNIEVLSQDLSYENRSNSLIYKGNIEVIQQVVDLY